MDFLQILIVAGIALALSLLMGLAWIVQQRTGNSGWVDTIWTYSVGLVGAGAALLPFGEALQLRQMLVGGLGLLWSMRLGTHIAPRAPAGMGDPPYANCAPGWGPPAPLG